MLPRATRRLILLAVCCTLPVASCGTREEHVAPAPTGVYDVGGRATRPVAPRDGRPNVIVLTLDTLRADGVSPYAEGPSAMPTLARLAREGTWFGEASSSAPWTLPALASLFTAHAPHRHGVTGEEGRQIRLEAQVTWAEVMRSTLGYQTAAWFGGLPSTAVAAFGEGFDHVADQFELQKAPELLDRWVETRQRDRPFFLFLHSFEAHDPYGAANHGPPVPGASEPALTELVALGAQPAPSELVRASVLDREKRLLLRTHPKLRAFQDGITSYLWSGLATSPDPSLPGELAAAYREGLTWVDGLVQRLLEFLEARGLLENTLLVVTSDHGEAFGEHGMLLHGRQLYDELVRIPMILKGPAPFDRPHQVQGSVGLTDLFPSIVTWLGAPAPEGVEGRSFLETFKAPGPGRPVQAEELRTRAHTAGLSLAHLVSVRNANWKYIGTLDETAGTLLEEAFDLRSDPLEQRNLAGKDGLMRDLPLDPAFCEAVEHARDRLWGSASQAAWAARQGYTSGAYTTLGERPVSTCEVAR